MTSLLIFAGCQWIDPCLEVEVVRYTSPDKIVDTVIIQKNCGATTSVNDLVFIVPHGKSVEEYSPVFIADHVEELEVEWVDKKLLEIRYREARIFNYTNFWHSKNIDNFKYQVKINEFPKE